MFSTMGLLTALVWTAFGSAIAAALAYFFQAQVVAEKGGYGRRDTYREANTQERTKYAYWAAGITAFLLFPTVKLVAYYWMPALVGPFGGYGVYVMFTVPLALAIGRFCAGGGKADLAVTGIGMLVGGYYIGVNLAYNVGSGNAQKFANMANIKVAPKDSKIPPSDPNHLLKVTANMAWIKGHGALGNLSSQYEVGSFTKQAVKGRRYWIAPLTLINEKDKWNIGAPESPGYVVVDAEDPEVEAEVKLNHHIKLFTDQSWGLNLNRFLYQNGFTDGSLENAKFEVDDEWRPYWVVTYVKCPFGGIAGSAIESVVLVKLTENGGEISTYNPEDEAERKQYAWVDRVMSYDLVKEYVSDWGMYHGDFGKKHYWQVFFGWDKQGTMAPGAIDLCYTTKEENVWVIPMTSTTGGHAVMGVLVYETNRNEATWYPEINGFNISSSAAATMQAAPANIKGYPVDSIQLMSIFDELTWVGIYSSSQRGGATPGGIGFLHAHGQNAGDVVFAPDEQTALAQYATQLVNRHNNNGKISKTAEHGKQLTGKVKRIAGLPSNTGTATWRFKVEGDQHSFLLTQNVYPDAALVKEGDEVTFTYVDTHGNAVPVSAFQCPDLDGVAQQKEKQPESQPAKN